MKKFSMVALALASALASTLGARGLNLNDIQLWSGSGTNRAGLVIEWSSPEILNDTTVPAPIADKAMVWGFRFNGTTNATALINAALRTDPRLYAVENNTYGAYVVSWGYNLKGNGILGITDGPNTDDGSEFIGGILTNEVSDPDAAFPINSSDLFWGGYYGPNWELWVEQGDAGGFQSSPDRGTNAYWISSNPSFYAGSQGQWKYAPLTLDDLPLHDGSWIGFSVAAAGDDYLHTNSVPTITYETHKHAPISPDGVYFASAPRSNDFGALVVHSTNVYDSTPYNDPAAMLGPPTLTFIDAGGTGDADRVKLIEAPYATAPNGSNVITEIFAGGEVTIKLGRKVYDDPNNPYGVDFIIYGNSFFSVSGITDFVSDATDLNTATLGSGVYGHHIVVSVSQDGSTWSTFTNEAAPFPDNAFRWDDANGIWTEEQSNPNKPLNPALNANNLAGLTVAGALDDFTGAVGGTGYDLQQAGLPWIQYVRIQAPSDDHAVIDAIAAVNPAVVGDALSFTPRNLTARQTTLAFADTAISNQVNVSLNFAAINDLARVSAVELHDFTPFAPIPGVPFGAYQITAASETGTNAIGLSASLALRASDAYNGNGSDLHVVQWSGTNWTFLPTSFNASTHAASVTGLTNLGAFAVTQIVQPKLAMAPGASQVTFQFTPQPFVNYTLQRASTLNAATWTPVAAVAPTNSAPATLQDSSPLATQAFYRLKLSL